MNTFNSIKELVSTLKREEKLISEMFSKRKMLRYKYSYALDLVEQDEARINFLLQRSVIRENGGLLEINDQFLDFFEQILDVNEAINLSSINDNIKRIKENINYYFNERNENRKYAYLQVVKKILRKIGIITLRNVVDLRRNIENTFKNEANYKNKQLKLENLDEKRSIVTNLIGQTLRLIKEEELTFFKTATDEELNRIIINLKHQLNECSHNLIEVEKQIIDYLNQIKQQGHFLEKLRKLKYLKDQFLIEGETNIRSVLAKRNEVLFEGRISEPMKLSIDYLRDHDSAFLSIQKIAKKHLNQLNSKPILADHISDEFLGNSIEEEVIIDLEEIKNSFTATSDHLFHFIANYNFLKEISFNERVTIYCQVVSQYEAELKIEEQFEVNNGVEYALVYPI